MASASAAQTPPPDSTSALNNSVDTKGVPQRDVIDLLNEHILHKRVEPEIEPTPTVGLQWSLLPTVSYNPVYGVSVGAVFSGAGRRGLGTPRYSSAAISANVSTSGQIQFLFRSDIFSPSGNYLLKADMRYLDTERSTWGLGRASSAQDEYAMEFKLGRVYATAYRRVSGPIF